MKFILSLALLALGATAQTTKAAGQGDSSCDADYIVTNCLELEQAKADNCDALDYDCQCAAAQSLATCYNNCPNDPRAPTAKNQVIVFCQNASLYGSAAKAKATQTNSAANSAANTAVTVAVTTTAAEESKASATGTPTGSAASSEKTNGAGEVMRNTGGVLMAVAGVVAAVL